MSDDAAPIPSEDQHAEIIAFADRATAITEAIQALVPPRHQDELARLMVLMGDQYAEFLGENIRQAFRDGLTTGRDQRPPPPAVNDTPEATIASRLTPEQAQRFEALAAELRTLLATPRADAWQALLAAHGAVRDMATDDEAAAHVTALLWRIDDLSAVFYSADPAPLVPGSDQPS